MKISLNLVKSLAFNLEQLRQYGNLNLCNFFGPPCTVIGVYYDTQPVPHITT